MIFGSSSSYCGSPMPLAHPNPRGVASSIGPRLLVPVDAYDLEARRCGSCYFMSQGKSTRTYRRQVAEVTWRTGFLPGSRLPNCVAFSSLAPSATSVNQRTLTGAPSEFEAARLGSNLQSAVNKRILSTGENGEFAGKSVAFDTDPWG